MQNCPLILYSLQKMLNVVRKKIHANCESLPSCCQCKIFPCFDCSKFNFSLLTCIQTVILPTEQCCWSGIRWLFVLWIQGQGRERNQDSEPWSGSVMNILDLFSESLEIISCVKSWTKCIKRQQTLNVGFSWKLTSKGTWRQVRGALWLYLQSINSIN